MVDNFANVLIPQMGVSVEDATVTVWHFNVGEYVEKDQVVCEITTDKVDTEISAAAGGVLFEIVVQEGQVAPVGAVIARIAIGSSDDSSGDIDDRSRTDDAVAVRVAKKASEAKELPSRFAGDQSSNNAVNNLAGAENAPHLAALEVVSRSGHRGNPVCSPLARRLAAAAGIDISVLKGSGLGGRVTREDVASTIAASVGIAAVPIQSPSDLPRGYADVPYEALPTSHQRRVISEHMVRSRRTAAHMTTNVDVDMHRVSSLRAEMNTARVAQGLVKVSHLSFIAVAACRTLRSYPDLNATFLEDRIIHWREVNMSIAVDAPQGLVTPVIRRCDQLGVDAIASEISRLALCARSKQLKPDDMRAGTFTLSNPGSVGATTAMAIINQPQVAILGVPAIVKRAWVVTLPDGTDSIAPRPICALALTFDHRAVDGAVATRFLMDVKEFLESADHSDYK